LSVAADLMDRPNPSDWRPSSGLFMACQVIVGVASWIIQDGNYADFAKGMDAAFAIEFRAAAPLIECEMSPSIRPFRTHLGNANYEAQGQVVYVANDWWAMDVGILAFREETPPAYVRPGVWLRGEISLDVDPFFYFERLGHQPGAPALVYEWKVEKICEQTAPLIETKPRVMALDPAKLGWREVEETEAWESTSGEYLLYCTRLNGPRLPKSKRAP
jgi:hypothetical protein